MKYCLFPCLILLVMPLRANMASPIEEGTKSTTAFVGTHVRIVHETLHIRPDSYFETAIFRIEYQIEAQQSGVQIPLLFYAVDYQDSFSVAVDGIPIHLQDVPARYEEMQGLLLRTYEGLFTVTDSMSKKTVPHTVLHGMLVDIRDLKFFETDMAAGPHQITVTYRARRWTDNSDWISRHSFRYLLAPAQYWQDFGGLTVWLDGSDCPTALSTNLGAGYATAPGQDTSWHFDYLPSDILEIQYAPALPPAARAAIWVGPEVWGVCTGILLALMHLGGRFWMRERFPVWLHRAAVILIPFLVLLGYVSSFTLIDYLIGDAASGRHGYVFLVFIFYPLLVPAYALLIWIGDWLIRQHARADFS
ncbi:MAG: hypothetical protein SF053_20130 [Bacteroidia bacterium]|nr:hypothetical protein [Bacteroidia bacterium]